MKQAQLGVKTVDEYLHNPPDQRLWNESYYFDFSSESISCYMRLGFQPFERRCNIWFYVTDGERLYWKRTERIPQENTHGLFFDVGDFDLNARVLQPKEKWKLDAEGTIHVADECWDVMTGNEETATVKTDLTYHDPIHEPVQMHMFKETQDHYNQFLKVDGTMTLNGTTHDVDAYGFRDHSWGWFRDWTPGQWGHYGCFIPFRPDDSVFMVSPIKPDGTTPRIPHGYHYGPGGLRPIKSGKVKVSDDLEHGERGEAWARGNLPDTFTYIPEFEEGPEEIVCTPIQNMPVGYEDRNWALTDLDSHWLKSVINRILLRCEWGNKETVGWMESTLPL